MTQTLSKEFYGKDADFFIGKFVKILDIQEQDRERSVVKVTFEVEN